MDSVKEVNMSKRKKDEAMPEVLWIVEYIDHMTRSDSFDGEAMPREQAEARCAELTENGTRETSKDKSALGYYELRQQRRVQ
jgi:glutaredoxin 2